MKCKNCLHKTKLVRHCRVCGFGELAHTVQDHVFKVCVNRPKMVHKAADKEGRAVCNFFSGIRGIGTNPRFKKWIVTRKWKNVTCKRCLARKEK